MLNDLLGRIRPVAVYDLTDRLLAWEAERGADSELFDTVRTRLVEEHLPRLVEAGLVEEVDEGEYTITEAGMAVEADARGIDLDALAPDSESESVPTD